MLPFKTNRKSTRMSGPLGGGGQPRQGAAMNPYRFSDSTGAPNVSIPLSAPAPASNGQFARAMAGMLPFGGQQGGGATSSLPASVAVFRQRRDAGIPAPQGFRSGQPPGAGSPMMSMQGTPSFPSHSDPMPLPQQQGAMGGGGSPWSQMAPMGGMPTGNPIRQAADYFRQARDQFRSGPMDQAARQEFQPTRDWFSSLQGMPRDRAMGMAAMGPPQQFAPPKLAPTMPVPAFQGMDPNSSMQDLISMLQRRTARGVPATPQPRTPGGGGSMSDPTGGYTNPFWGR